MLTYTLLTLYNYTLLTLIITYKYMQPEEEAGVVGS